MEQTEKQGFIDSLQAKLETLKTEIEQAQADIEQKSTVVNHKREQVEYILKLLEAEGIIIERAKLHGTVSVSLGEMAIAVLRQNSRPMHYAELTEQIQKTGFKISGKSPQATLLAFLHRKQDLFTRFEPGIWGLKEWPMSSNPTKTKRKRKLRKASH